jgi:hypothetical protein
MDPNTMPVVEREEAMAREDCPYCQVQAGAPCRKASGESYQYAADVHADRLIRLYRRAYRSTDQQKHDAAFEQGWNTGWQDGVSAAQEALERLMREQSPVG